MLNTACARLPVIYPAAACVSDLVLRFSEINPGRISSYRLSGAFGKDKGDQGFVEREIALGHGL